MPALPTAPTVSTALINSIRCRPSLRAARVLHVDDEAADACHVELYRRATGGGTLELRQLNLSDAQFAAAVTALVDVNRANHDIARSVWERGSLSKESQRHWSLRLPEEDAADLACAAFRALIDLGLAGAVLVDETHEAALIEGQEQLRQDAARRLAEQERAETAAQVLRAINETRTFDHALSEQMLSEALHRRDITRDQARSATEPVPGWLYSVMGQNVLVTAVYADKARAAVVNVRAGKRDGDRWFVDLVQLQPVALELGACGLWLKR